MFRILAIGVAVAIGLGSPLAYAQSGLTEAAGARDVVPSRDVLVAGLGPGNKNGRLRDKLGDGGFGVPAGGFWLYPSVTTSVTFDDNVFATKTNRSSDIVTRVGASTVARAQSGLNDFFGYVSVEGRVFSKQTSLDSVDGRVGFVNLYELRKDLVIRLQGEYAHKNELPGPAAYFAATPVALNKPVTYDEGFGALSINKDFGSAHMSLGGSITTASYANPTDIFGRTVDQSYRNGQVYTALTRMGYYITPVVSAFVEPSYGWRQFQNTPQGTFSSEGYKIVSGLATDRISLFKGEIYGGYAAQRYTHAQLGEFSSGVYGGRLVYLASQLMDMTGSVEQRLGESAYRPLIATALPGSITWSTVKRLQTDYRFAAAATWTGFVEYTRSEFLNINRNDDAVRLGTSLTYNLNRNLTAGVEYQYSTLTSSVNAFDYNRNEVLVSLKGRF